MTDLYIATPTQTDYDALMRLAEAAGYTWQDRHLPTKENWWDCDEDESVVHLYDDPCDRKRMMHDNRTYYESLGATIGTIPNLADIKAVWHITKGNHPDFVTVYPKAKHMLIIENGLVIQNEDGSFDYYDSPKYKALAVEYKPKESEIMPEKVKLPKVVCDYLDTVNTNKYPLALISEIHANRHFAFKTEEWLSSDEDNQWKLIDALRNGYEPEPEQLYYVQFVEDNKNSFLKLDTADDSLYMGDRLEITKTTKTQFTMEQIRKISPKFEQFAVKVEEVDNDD